MSVSVAQTLRAIQVMSWLARADDVTWNEDDHPRDSDGKFTTGGSGKKIAHASSQLPAGSESMYKYHKPALLALDKIISKGVEIGSSPEEVAKGVKALISTFKHSSIVSYGNKVLSHIEETNGLPKGSLGKALGKGVAPPPAQTPAAQPETPAPSPAPATMGLPLPVDFDQMGEGTQNNLMKIMEIAHQPGVPAWKKAAQMWDIAQNFESGGIIQKYAAASAKAVGADWPHDEPKPSAPPENPDIAAAKLGNGPLAPHPESSIQKKIAAIAMNADLSNSEKGYEIAAALMSANAPQGGFSAKFAEKWKQALGIAPQATPATQPKPAATAAASSLPPGTMRTANAKAWSRWESLHNEAKKLTSTQDAGAKAIAKTLDESWWAKQSASARQAVKNYVDGAYGSINSALRGQNTNPGVLKEIQEIDELFEEESAELTEDVVLRRGEDIPADVINQLEQTMKSGLPCRYFKTGFVSTSMASKAAFSNKNTSFEIVARKGTPALGVDALSPHTENEVLLRHGQVFEVVEIRREGEKTHIKMYTRG